MYNAEPFSALFLRNVLFIIFKAMVFWVFMLKMKMFPLLKLENDDLKIFISETSINFKEKPEKPSNERKSFSMKEIFNAPVNCIELPLET